MVFQLGVFQAGVFQQDGEQTGLNAHEVGDDVFAGEGSPIVTAVLAAHEVGADVADVIGAPILIGVLDAAEVGSDTVDIFGAYGQLWAVEVGHDTFEGNGDSEGNIIIIPRNIAEGIAYLLELEAFDPVLDETVILTYSSGGFVTKPTDALPNTVYDPHIDVPGDYSRSMFGTGGTAGEIRVGAGIVKLINLDGTLDHLSDLAFDGRPLTIKTVARLNPRYENAVTVFKGTMSHAEFGIGEINILIRDRLALLDKPIQETTYAGTTIAGGVNEAEGRPEDLKGRPKPLPFGMPLNVEAVASNVFDRIYDVGEGGMSEIAAVRDHGVLLTPFGTSYPTISALRAAAIPAGSWAGSVALGKFRLGSEPKGLVTARPVSGATAADRTAAQLARRIMLRMGLVEDVDFLGSDVAALDTLNGAEIGVWVGTEEETALSVVSRILNSIGASCVPDRLGVFRLYRFDPASPEDFPSLVIIEDVIMEGSANIERLGTGDRGSGIPAWRVNLNYAHNGAVMSPSELAEGELALTDAFRGFAGKEWRVATAEDEDVKARHLLSPELSFDTYLIHEADAQAEAARRLAMYGVRRDRYRVPVPSFLAEPVDLNSVVELRIDRFGLSAGKKFRVIGIDENFETGITTLDIWG